MPTEAERNYEVMRIANREAQAAMERAAGELLRERELADTLAEALLAVKPYFRGDASQDAWDAGELAAKALTQWREARARL